MNIAFQSLRRGWIALSGLYLLLLVHVAVYVSAGHNDSFLILALLSGLLAVSVIGFTLVLTPARWAILRQRLAPGLWPGMIAAWGVLFVFGMEMRPQWIYPQLGLTLCATVFLGFVTIADSTPPIRWSRRWLVLGLGVVLVITGLRIAALSYYPSLNEHDEGWNLGWMSEYNDTGVLSNRITGNPQDQSVVRFYILGAWWVRLVGAGLWEARIFFFLLTFVVMIFSPWAAYNLYGRRTALCTAGVLFSSAVLMSIARLRHDIALTIALSVSLWLYSEALKRERLWLHGLAGLAMGWGAFGHYNAIGMGVVLLISLYGPRYAARLREGKRWPEAAVWYYGTGGLIAGLHVAIVQVWKTYTSSSGYLSTGRSLNPGVLADFIGTHITNLTNLSQFEALLLVLAIGAALWRRRSIDISLVLMVLLTPLALAIISQAPWIYYPIPSVAFYSILIGSLLAEGLTRASSPGEKYETRGIPSITLVAGMTFSILSLGFSLHWPLNHITSGDPVRLPTPEPAQWILDHVEPHSTVVGEHVYYLWLLDYEFLSPTLPDTPYTYQRNRDRYAGLSREEIWDLQDVDVFIINPTLPAALLVPSVESEYFESRGYTCVVQFDDNTRIYYRGSCPPASEAG